MRSATSTADRREPTSGATERGARVVEFLGVAVLTVLALLTIAQVAMWTWARNVAVSAAHQGARQPKRAARWIYA